MTQWARSGSLEDLVADLQLRMSRVERYLQLAPAGVEAEAEPEVVTERESEPPLKPKSAQMFEAPPSAPPIAPTPTPTVPPPLPATQLTVEKLVHMRTHRTDWTPAPVPGPASAPIPAA